MVNLLVLLSMDALRVLSLTVEDFLPDLEKRKGGTQKGHDTAQGGRPADL